MSRQHLLTDDDLADLLGECDALRDRVADLLDVKQAQERTIHDLRRELASARHPTVPADSVFDPHPADLIPR